MHVSDTSLGWNSFAGWNRFTWVLGRWISVCLSLCCEAGQNKYKFVDAVGDTFCFSVILDHDLGSRSVDECGTGRFDLMGYLSRAAQKLAGHWHYPGGGFVSCAVHGRLPSSRAALRSEGGCLELSSSVFWWGRASMTHLCENSRCWLYWLIYAMRLSHGYLRKSLMATRGLSGTTKVLEIYRMTLCGHFGVGHNWGYELMLQFVLLFPSFYNWDCWANTCWK